MTLSRWSFVCLYLCVCLSLFVLPSSVSSQVTAPSALQGWSSVFGIAMDSVRGRVYVSDAANNVILVLTSNFSQITTWSVNNSLKSPNGLCLDSQGNLYVADFSNSRVVQLSSSGVLLSVFRGPSNFLPYAVQVNTSTNTVYATDLLLPTRVIVWVNNQTWTYNYSAPYTRSYYYGLALDSSNNIYVSYGTGIDVYAANGSFLTNYTVSPQASVRCITMDNNNNLLMADAGRDYLIQMSTTGIILQATQGNPPVMVNPYAVAIDGNGVVAITDTSGSLNRIFTFSISTFSQTGVYMSQYPSLNNPAGVAIDSIGRIYVADRLNLRTLQLMPNGTLITQWDRTRALSYPDDVKVDSQGNIIIVSWVSYPGQGVVKLSANGTFLLRFVYSNVSSAGVSVAVDSNDNIYTADQDNNVVNKFSPSGVFLQNFTASNPGFTAIFGVAVDALGSVYVSDGYVGGINSPRIVKFSAAGVQVASFPLPYIYPTGVAVDSTGNIYVAFGSNAILLKMDANGGFIGTQQSTRSPPGTYGTYNECMGMTIDNAGNVYVAHYLMNRIDIYPSADAAFVPWPYSSSSSSSSSLSSSLRSSSSSSSSSSIGPSSSSSSASSSFSSSLSPSSSAFPPICSSATPSSSSSSSSSALLTSSSFSSSSSSSSCGSSASSSSHFSSSSSSPSTSCSSSGSSTGSSSGSENASSSGYTESSSSSSSTTVIIAVVVSVSVVCLSVGGLLLWCRYTQRGPFTPSAQWKKAKDSHSEDRFMQHETLSDDGGTELGYTAHTNGFGRHV